MSLRNLCKNLFTGFIAVVLLAIFLTPVIRPARVSASFNDHLKYSTKSLRIKVNDPSLINSSQLSSVLGRHGHVDNISKLFHKNADNATQNSLSTALDGYYTVNFNNDVDMNQTVNDLKSVPGVITAYPQVKPAPSPSANYTSQETYLRSAPTGIDSNYASTVAGGNGSNAKIVDIEYSWNTAHEDLAKANTALVPHGTPVDPFTNNDHGTAVLGEMIATNNTYGVTGAANGASLALINAYSSEYGYDLVGALNSAASLTKPGDVIMLEQQTWGPTPDTYDYVPVEWIPEVYDAIHSLTTNGRVVVEPAGNGNQNLDDSSYYGTSFPMGKLDSGAIIVGAGLNCSTDSYLRSRAAFSTYGSRVNLQGPGNCVVTSGYGDLYSTSDTNAYYTQYFNGTSSATPIVAAAAADLSSVYMSRFGKPLTSIQIRSNLMQYGTPQNSTSGSLTGNIGVYPDLAKSISSFIDSTPPSIPQNLKVSLNSSNRPVLTWNAANDNVAVTSYLIYRNGVYYATTTNLSYTDSSTNKKTIYKYQVAAVDKAGNVSQLSASVSIKTR